MQIYKLLILVFISFINIGCATTWVTLNAEDETQKVDMYFTEVRQAAMDEKKIVLELLRRGRPMAVDKKIAGVYKVCFDRDMTFVDELGFYLDKETESQHFCKDDISLKQLSTMQVVENLSDSFFIPELNIAISGITSGAGISPARSLCHCDELKNLKSAVASAVYFGQYRFYLMLENGKRLRFSSVSEPYSTDAKQTIFNYYEVMEATEEQFLNEKFKPKPAQIIPLDEGSYLLVQLKEYTDYVFYSPELFFSQSERFSRLVFSKQRGIIVDKEGNKIYYALLPFAAIFDVVTIPFQIGYFVYQMGQVR